MTLQIHVAILRLINLLFFFLAVIFTGKLYKKDPQQHPEVKRLLVFLLERHVSKLFFCGCELGLVNSCLLNSLGFVFNSYLLIEISS